MIYFSIIYHLNERLCLKNTSSKSINILNLYFDKILVRIAKYCKKVIIDKEKIFTGDHEFKNDSHK